MGNFTVIFLNATPAAPISVFWEGRKWLHPQGNCKMVEQGWGYHSGQSGHGLTAIIYASSEYSPMSQQQPLVNMTMETSM